MLFILRNNFYYVKEVLVMRALKTPHNRTDIGIAIDILLNNGKLIEGDQPISKSASRPRSRILINPFYESGGRAFYFLNTIEPMLSRCGSIFHACPLLDIIIYLFII